MPVTAAPTATDRLAAFVAELRFAALPPEVVAQARRVILDALGCAFAAHAEEPAKAAVALGLAARFPAPEAAQVIGGPRTAPAIAALANGFLVNATDNDDTHKRALLHVGSVVVPAALAMVQERSGTGRDLIAAVVAGYEVCTRVGMAVMPAHYAFWHSTATNGTFGAAVAAAHVAGLDAAGVRTALGLAGTQAAGLNTFFASGDDSKSVHPGKAAMNGILAATLAELGASAPPDIFGHPRGYLAAYSSDPHPEALTAGLGTRWEILQNGFKAYPSILASHSAIGAALEIFERHRPDPAAIAAVTIRSYATVKSHFSNREIAGPMSARLSVPCCALLALLDGAVTQAQFRPARLADPTLRALLERTEVVADAACTAAYPDRFVAHVEVAMSDGRRLHALREYPHGDPQDPLTDEELEAKFLGNMATVLPAEGPRLLEAILALGEPGADPLPALPSLSAAPTATRGPADV